MTKSKVLSFQEVLAIMREQFLKNDFSLTPSTKKILRRNLEKCFGDKLKFISIKNRSFLYSFEIDVEKVIKDLSEKREQSCYVAKTARFIHKEIKAMKDEMPWPSQLNDLNPDNFKMPKKLGEFLTTLIASKDDKDGISSRHARLRHSLAQDIVYIVTKGRIKTPKSVLLPSIIKQLTNNTELINTIH